MISFLTKIGQNEFRIDFNSEIWYRRSKSVVVDGEIYTKDCTEVCRIDSKTDFENAGEVIDYWHEESRKYIDKSKGDNWERLVIDDFFDYNGEIYYVWNYKGFLYSPAESLTGCCSSTVGNVRILNSLVNENHVNGIYSISYGKNDLGIRDRIENILEDRKLWFDVMDYGFNNTVRIGVSLYKILKTDFSDKKGTWFYRQMKIYSDYAPSIFPQKMLIKKLTDIERNEIAIKVLNNSINLKQGKKL